MKNNIIILLVGILMLAGCEEIEVGNNFLEKPPSVDVTIDTIFSKLEYANRLLTGAYRSLHYGYLYNLDAKGIGMDADVLESLSDLTQSFRLDGGVNRIYYSGQYSAGTENTNSTKYTFWGPEDNWSGIRQSYILIENIDKVPDADQATKDRMKAEARMIIACHYVDMYRHFGGVPWINKSVGITDEMNFPRLTTRQMVDSIVNVIDMAIPDLPWVLDDVANNDGRFTKASAMGLKARLLLFAASPLFNSDQPYREGEASDLKMTWHGGYDANLWKRAADAAKELIDMIDSKGGYGLVNTGNPRADFRRAYYNRGNGEILISTRVYYQTNSDYEYAGIDLFIGHGIACPTQESVDNYGMDNGLPIDHPDSGYDPNNPYINRDPRLYESVLVNGDVFQGRTAELWIGGRERTSKSNWATATGYDPRKFVLDRDGATSRGSVIQFPYLRLPEIYLTYAEAINEYNGGPTAEAYDAVNRVRNRVNLPDLPTGLSQEEFREAVLNERACEFLLEEVRFFDMIRWKRAEDFYKKLHGMDIYRDGVTGAFTYNLFELPARAWQGEENWDPKWYLSALPPNEINKGYGLVQNPGW
jgi:hypothetical protein